MEQLKAQKPLVQAYVMDEIFDKMIGGEAAVGVYYSGDAITMIDDNPDLAWVFPEEGSVLSVDCMCIPATSQNQEAAEMFINFMCEVDVGVANAEYIGYTTPSTAVWEQLDEALKYSEIAYPSAEIAAKEQVFTALSEEVNSQLDIKWSEMKSYDEGAAATCSCFCFWPWFCWPVSTSGARCAARCAICTESVLKGEGQWIIRAFTPNRSPCRREMWITGA